MHDYLRPKVSLLSYVIYTDGSLQLQEALEKRERQDSETGLSTLLHFALPDIHSQRPLNMHAIELLVERGAVPFYSLGGINPWQKVLGTLVVVLHRYERPEITEKVAKLFKVLAMFVKCAQDLEQCREMCVKETDLLTSATSALESDRKWNAPGVLLELVLNRGCCSGVLVRKRGCFQAGHVERIATRMLYDIGVDWEDISSPKPASPTRAQVTTSDSIASDEATVTQVLQSTSLRSKFRRLGLKGMFSSLHEQNSQR